MQQSNKFIYKDRSSRFVYTWQTKWQNILTLLNEWLDREKLVLSMWILKNKEQKQKQEWKISGIELSIDWIKNNFNS